MECSPRFFRAFSTFFLHPLRRDVFPQIFWYYTVMKYEAPPSPTPPAETPITELSLHDALNALRVSGQPSLPLRGRRRPHCRRPLPAACRPGSPGRAAAPRRHGDPAWRLPARRRFQRRRGLLGISSHRHDHERSGADGADFRAWPEPLYGRALSRAGRLGKPPAVWPAGAAGRDFALAAAAVCLSAAAFGSAVRHSCRRASGRSLHRAPAAAFRKDRPHHAARPSALRHQHLRRLYASFCCLF